jgi:hypothetical protein
MDDALFIRDEHGVVRTDPKSVIDDALFCS